MPAPNPDKTPTQETPVVWRTSTQERLSPLSWAVVVLIVLAWVLTIMSTQARDHEFAPTTVVAWANTCPDCGTVESVLIRHLQHAAAPTYRLTIRMSDGTMRLLEPAKLFAPGTRVLVNDDHVIPASGDAAPG